MGRSGPIALSLFATALGLGSFLVSQAPSSVAHLASSTQPGACFVDDVDHRQLPHQVCLMGDGCETLSLEWCGQQCRALNYTLAGVEASHQCACANELTTPSAAAPAKDCNMACTGDKRETCGGKYRVWVFNASAVGPPPPAPELPAVDNRYIPNGDFIYKGGYSCQPYCSVMPNGTWSCVMTWIADRWAEGSPGEHMVGMRTSDRGKTWSEFVPLASYSNKTTGDVSAYGSVTARADGSRVFALWIQNVHNVSHLPGQPPNPGGFRADMLGEFVWKYSDDQGATWSERHYPIPIPKGYIESVNSWKGAVQIMWEVDHLKQHEGRVLFAFTKIGTYAVAPPEEMFVVSSPNLLTEDDPAKVTWEMWPEGEHGVPAVGGLSTKVVSEEPHVTPLTSVDRYSLVFRTTQDYLGSALSQIGNPKLAWHASEFAKYLAPAGGEDWLAQLGANCSWVKNPRGPISPKRQPNGQVLMTYYNTAQLEGFGQTVGLSDRNNMWLTAGLEVDGELRWTQPELVLYERQHSRGHGYPDLVRTADGELYITEAFKAYPYAESRTHHVNPKLLEALFQQTTISQLHEDTLALTFVGKAAAAQLPPGALPDLMQYPVDRYGLTVDMWLAVDKAGGAVESPLLEASHGTAGVKVSLFANGTVKLVLGDADGNVFSHMTDPVCSARVKQGAAGQMVYVAAVVDGGPRMVQFLVDGHLCDGGPHKDWPNGFKLVQGPLGDVGAGVQALSAAPGVVVTGRLYSSALYNSQLIGNWRFGVDNGVHERAVGHRAETIAVE